ncbi:MAG: hypothetical protein LBV46_01320 [Bacteroidales bacterium]|jgi:hypothetical protein|nr:hypothetical protein [Bacteroidales bacterium]
MENVEKRDRLISGSITAIVMGLLFLLCFFCGLSYQYPPPPPHKAMLIELSTFDGGGGGGGGTENPSHQRHTRSSGERIATQNHQDAPVVNRSNATNRNHTDPTPTPTPQLNPNATYRPGTGGGSGGGSGTGTGSGTGSGIGPGSGSGSGGGSGSGTGTGIGYGTGNRGLINNIDLNVNENGQVCVEVHVLADGSVAGARIISSAKYPTTITNASIQANCIVRAKSARYRSGNEEYRVIIFK